VQFPHRAFFVSEPSTEGFIMSLQSAEEPIQDATGIAPCNGPNFVL
jgi:hypothetical protein